MIPFSSTDRSLYIDKLTRKRVDILVIGGGITGAGILLDAANRGFEVALLEKTDFGAGTSSRSTKLIHGGLRYLKQLQFGLVKETGIERAIVYNNARHLVEKCKMLLPFYKGGAMGPVTTSMALYMYDRLAKVAKAEHKMILKKTTTIRIEPLLKEDNLKGAGLYYEYKVDDCRLTLEIIKKAIESDATALNYMKVTDFVYENDKVAGVKVTDLITGIEHEIFANFIVNATGPWTDTVAQQEKTQRGIKKVILSKGIHIVFPKNKLPIKQPVYFESSVDKRMIFAIPHGQYTYVGTTDTPFEGDIEHPQATLQEVKYLIESANNIFTKIVLKESDVSSTWAGLRPLIFKPGKNFKELSRKDEVFISPSGLITIAGGKLTGYRKMAERVVQIIIDEFKKQADKARPILHEEALTDLSNVSGSEFQSEDEYEKLYNYCLSLKNHLEVEEEVLHDLFCRYGKNTEQIIALAEKQNGIVEDPNLRLEIGGLLYGIKQEMVCTISDFLIRRSGQLYFGREKIKKYLEELLHVLRAELKLSDDQVDQMRVDFENQYAAVMAWQKETL
ncbi:MAG: glycerol-3-phosphate dehydrogenase/oxidase [Saprospiraceae bacterium]